MFLMPVGENGAIHLAARHFILYFIVFNFAVKNVVIFRLFQNRASLMYFCLSPNLQIRGEGWWLPIQGLIILTQERQRESYVSVGHTKIIKTYYRYVSNNDISKPVLTKLLFLIVASMNHLLHAYCRYIYLTVEISACFIFTIPVCE